MPISQDGFNFAWLYFNYTLPELAKDPSIPVYPYPDKSAIALPYELCLAAVGAGWSWYTRHDVYDRVLLWRVPLLALCATTTLPSFELHTKIFTLQHLVADPIDTFRSLFKKLYLAQSNAQWVRELDSNPELLTDFTPPNLVLDANDIEASVSAGDLLQYHRDVIALAITAYDEWGQGVKAMRALNYSFHHKRWTANQLAQLRTRCASAAFYITADRVSRFLPSIASTLVFLVQVSAGFWKTLYALKDKSSTNPDDVSQNLNRTPHNIAFGVLFFWLPLAVLMTAYVGGSQTSHLVPRVLQTLQEDIIMIQSQSPPQLDVMHDFEEESFPDLNHISDKRWSHGGLPVWQISTSEKYPVSTTNDRRPQRRLQRMQPSEALWLLVSVAIVAIPTVCAISISWLTPTEGFGCRTVTQLSFLLIWIASAAIDRALLAFLPNDENVTDSSRNSKSKSKRSWRCVRLYWLVFLKDFLFMSGIIVLLTFTALGIFNSCNCWTKWSPIPSQRYISFPQEPYIFNLLKHRLQSTFPAIVIFALLSQIFIFIAIYVYFAEGHRVLKQRDLEDLKKGPNFFKQYWRSFSRTVERYWQKLATAMKRQWQRFSRCIKRQWHDLPQRSRKQKPRYMASYSSIPINSYSGGKNDWKRNGEGTVETFELVSPARYGCT